MKFSALALAAGLAFMSSAAALAADVLPTKAPAYSGYPTAKCGWYFGVGTGGYSGAINNGPVGAQIVQGDLDAIGGYTCPFGTAGFWFGEASAGFSNINGNVNGIALTGPAIFTERFGIGTPINQLFNPFGSNLALPSLPLLPTGVTAGAASGYFFGGLVEQDVGAQIGNGSTHQFLIAPIVGVGLLTRLNGNSSVIDTWAGFQLNSDSICPKANACTGLGNGVRVGVSFKY